MPNAAPSSPIANSPAAAPDPGGDSPGRTISPRELEARRRDGSAPLILDVRSWLEFEGEHIEGARVMPYEQVASRVDEIPESSEVVVVCRAGIRAATIADELGRAGRRARVLDGGMNAWTRAGLPVLKGRKRLPVDRQVQLIVGSLVVASVALGAFVSPWFLAVSAFFGAGLIFAGASGFCGMAHMLTKMPWNQVQSLSPPGRG